MQVDPYDQNEMMDARFTYFHFPCSLPKKDRRVVSPCPKCFARWVCSMPPDLLEPAGPPQHRPPPSVPMRLEQDLPDPFPEFPSSPPRSCPPSSALMRLAQNLPDSFLESPTPETSLPAQVPGPSSQEDASLLGPTQMWGQAPDTPRSLRRAPVTPPNLSNGQVPGTRGVSAAPQPGLAAGLEAVTDWLETHGGEVHLHGPRANVAELSDKLCWSTQFLPSCGRLLPFLRKYGISAIPDAVTGVSIAQSCSPTASWG